MPVSRSQGGSKPQYVHVIGRFRQSPGNPCRGGLCRNECARDGAQSAWWKSTPGEAITLEVEGNCVVV
ncbi:MAG: hypothetical protein ACRESZ_10420, partial [Methylococcales bacterium]